VLVAAKVLVADDALDGLLPNPLGERLPAFEEPRPLAAKDIESVIFGPGEVILRRTHDA
jgi:hypothetical protein